MLLSGEERRIGTYIGCKETYPGFQEIVLDRPLHEVVVDRRFCHLFVILHRLVIVAIEGSKICYF
jgi:hypothetical protein